MPITHVAIVNAKPREKPYRLFDPAGDYHRDDLLWCDKDLGHWTSGLLPEESVYR